MLCQLVQNWPVSKRDRADTKGTSLFSTLHCSLPQNVAYLMIIGLSCNCLLSANMCLIIYLILLKADMKDAQHILSF